jgi:hypothetical protein
MRQFNKPGVVPVAFVTKGRQRLKQYDDTVYLRNDDEFELELFNPTKTKVLCKISLNGMSIGSGIVLRPGERVFLERYIDVAKKFRFGTYTVNGENKEVLAAIQENGLVTVKFYKESFPVQSMSQFHGKLQLFNDYIPPFINNPSTTNPNPWPPTWTTTCSSVLGSGLNSSTTMRDANSTFTNSAMFSADIPNHESPETLATMDFMDMEFSRGIVDVPKPRSMSKKLKSLKSMETGTIEQGSHSNQPFTLDSTTFEHHWTWMTEWKILPVSRKLTVIEDLKIYCVECGTKRKGDSHKFCPNCGTKYE